MQKVETSYVNRSRSKVSNISTIDSLKNHFLIAMPSHTDKYFSRSVTYIVEHSSEGAMGLVVNLPSNLNFKDLIEQSDAGETDVLNSQEKVVVCGGPVYRDRGFILHTTQPGYSSSVEVSSEIMLTTSKDILSAISKQEGPEKSIVALGYAGWEAGQLEQEIQDNAWLTIEADDEILFDVPIHQKWQAAVNKLGIDVWQLTQNSGQA